LNCDVAWILETIQLSEVPKSARAPVSGWMNAMLMGLLLTLPALLLPALP